MKKARVIPHTSWAAKSLWSVEGKTMSMLLFALAILGIGDGLIVLANLGLISIDDALVEIIPFVRKMWQVSN